MTNIVLWKKLAILILGILMVYSLVAPPWNDEMAPARTTEEVAEGVFEDFGFTFMILAILLAAAMIGGIYMAKMPPEAHRRYEKGKILEMRMKPRRRVGRRGGV